jgi:ribosomal protein L31E
MRNEEDKAMKAPGSETLAKFGGTPKMKTGGNPVQKIKKAVSAVKNFFSKKPKVNKNVIDDTNVGKLLFRGVNRKGESTFKVGTSGKVLHESSNILPRSQKFQNLLKNWKKTTK